MENKLILKKVSEIIENNVYSDEKKIEMIQEVVNIQKKIDFHSVLNINHKKTGFLFIYIQIKKSFQISNIIPLNTKKFYLSKKKVEQKY